MFAVPVAGSVEAEKSVKPKSALVLPTPKLKPTHCAVLSL